MGNRVREAGFARFVAAHRPELSGVAYLMYSSAERAEQVVQAELARLYSSWPLRADPRQVVLRELLTSTPARLVLPSQRSDRFELVDHELDPPPSGIVGELADLDDDARRAVILVGLVGLPLADAAAVLRREESEVESLVARATAELVERDPVRASPDELTEQLRTAARGALLGQDLSGAGDLGRGRLLVRRRLLRTGLVAAGTVLAVLVGLTQLTTPATRADEPAGHTATAAPPVVVPAPPPSPRPTCDTHEASCRNAVLQQWRSDMARLTTSYVDPGHDYFTQLSGGDSGLDGPGQLWGGGQGALGVRLSRSLGATDVYVQVATSRREALHCGTVTHHPCAPQDFLDGNTFNLTQTIDVRQGMEIQYSPRGDEVITVVARNTSRGRTLDITRPQLMSLVTDPRLRLPPH